MTAVHENPSSPITPGSLTGSPTVSAIVVTYNTRDLTLRCITDLKAALANIPSEIFVVDNDSKDDSAAAIRAAFPAVTLLEPKQNLGFGLANNLAMGKARGQYFLLVNSDAFMPPGSVATLLRVAEAHPNAGVVGPRLLYENRKLQPSCYRFPTPTLCWLENLWITAISKPLSPTGDYRRWPHDREQEVDWLIGACMLVRRQAYEAAGGFDPRFFMYGEETDWQRSIKDAGYSILFTPATEVVHLAGGSGHNQKAQIRASFFDSLDLYVRKHHGLPGFLSMRAAMIVGSSLRAIVWIAAWLLRAKDAGVAASKIKLHLHLLRRQSTYWPSSPPSFPKGAA